MRWIVPCLVLPLLLLATVATDGQSFGIFQVNGPAIGALKRTGFNMNFTSTADYAFIDFLQSGDGFPSAHQNWTLSAPVWNANILDANGWPCTNAVNVSCPYSGANNPAQSGRDFGGGLHLPASSNYSGNYCLQGLGSGTISLNSQLGGGFAKAANGTVTCAGFNGSANNCTSANVSGSGPFTVTDETWSGWCVAFTYSGPIGSLVATLYISSDDPNNSGHYVKAMHLYEQADGSDFAAGKMFRSAYKSQIVSLDPAFIRFLNWNSNEGAMRFTDRATPTNTPYSNTGLRWAGQLLYTAATVSANTQYTVAAVTGTAPSMVHGEQLVVTTPNNGPGATGPNNISTITISGTTVTVVVGGGSSGVFSTGDTVVFVGLPVADNDLNSFYQSSITADSATQFHFTFANAASLSNCSSSCGTVAEGYRLQVGSGNDRTMYPWMDTDGRTPFGRGETTQTAGAYRLCFSKTITASTDGSGNLLYGAWYHCGLDVVPIEYEVELVNELNAMSPVHPINMWISTPVAGLICSSYYSDPDCSASVDWPVNMVKTVLNGANGFSGLCAQCLLIVEDVNETWNGTSSTGFLDGMGGQPATVGKVGCGTSDINSYSTLHSELVMNDIQTGGYPLGGSRVKYALGGWMWVASISSARMTGIGIGVTGCQPAPPTMSAPIMLYDYMNLAPYLNGSTIASLNLSTLAATWGSDVASFGFSSSQALADLAAWTGPMTTDTSTNAETIANAETIFSSLASTISGYGSNKAVISYEGWWDDNVTSFAYITSISCAAGTVTVSANGGNYSSPMVIQNVSVAGYNGVWTTTGSLGSFTYSVGTCPVGTPSATAYQGYYGSAMVETNAFLAAARDSSAFATDYQGFLNYVQSHANVGIPGFYVQVDPRWGVAFPDTYGATSTEGNGNDPTFTMMGNFNRAQAN